MATLHIYTDSPALHPNLIVGSLQLLFWLLVHPLAWQNHIARIDPYLPADFTLLKLSRAHWRHPALQRLLINSYFVWPMIMGLVVWLSGIAGASQVFGVPRGILGGILFAVAVNLTLAVLGSLTISVPMGLVSGVVGSLAYSLGSTWSPGPARTAALVVAVGLALGVVGSAAFGVATIATRNSRGQKSPYSMRQRMSGLVIGSFIGIVGPLLVISLPIWMAGSEMLKILQRFAEIENWLNMTVLQIAVVVAASGIVLAVAVGQRIPLHYGLMLGIIFGVVFGPIRILALDVVPDLAGVGNVTLLSLLFALCYDLTERIAGPRTGVVAGALGSGVGFILGVIDHQPWWPILPIGICCIILGLTLPWWRPIVLYPFLTVWNLWLYWLDDRQPYRTPSLLRLHAAFWDEYQQLSYLGLDDHLLLVLGQNPDEGQRALTYLTTHSQRWAAQAAQIELDARILETCLDIAAIGQVHQTLAAGGLAGPASALLRSFSRLSQDVQSALQQESAYNQRLALTGVEERLDGLLRELTRSSEPYAERFRPVVTLWHTTVASYNQELTATAEAQQEIDNPYITGIPLTEQQEIFTGRTDISARIEQLLRDERRPPLFLYGQRRMGKTSLLNNLGRLLPTTVVPLFVDLQGASRASDETGLLYNIARDMVKSAIQRRDLTLPPLTREPLIVDPFTRFDEWMDEVEDILEAHGQATALLALDEFETLESGLANGRFKEEDVLGMLRHLIQHRPRFKVLLAGSHPLEKFQRWASYLINIQIIHISYLHDAEARHLIEQPVKNFALQYEPEAIQRLLTLTRGHPFLIQLLCAELVAFKNEQETDRRRLANLADVEAVIPQALLSGSFFFADIQHNQIDAAGLTMLQVLASHGEGGIIDPETLSRHPKLVDVPDLSATLSQLMGRELIEMADTGYRFQVELIRRWFGQR